MSSPASQLLDHIVTRLSAVNGTGDYIHNLSGTDQVQIAQPPASTPRTLPVAYIYDMDISSEPGASLPQFIHTLQVSILGMTAAATLTESALVKAAADLASDIHRTITADRSPNVTGAVSVDVRTTSAVAASGPQTAYKGVGLVAVIVTIRYYGAL